MSDRAADSAQSVDAALAQARQRGIERLDAHWLLAWVLNKDRTWLLAHGEALLDAQAAVRFEQGIARRLAGEPLAYLLGEKEFYGLRLAVDARVLVPRPETELLVDWALELLATELVGDWSQRPQPRAVDLGTGSGAIALALKHRQPPLEVWACDDSEDALDVARLNARQLGLAVHFTRGSWWQAVPGQRFHLALSNPPYIAAADRHLAALRSEPLGALSPGPSGLEALETIIAQAPEHLEPGGWLLLEHGFDQAEAVQALLEQRGFAEPQTRTDLAGHPRCTGARL